MPTNAELIQQSTKVAEEAAKAAGLPTFQPGATTTATGGIQSTGKAYNPQIASNNVQQNVGVGTLPIPGSTGFTPFNLASGVASTSSAFGQDVTTYQDLLKKTEEAQRIYQSTLGPSTQTLDISKQLADIRAQEEALQLSLEKGKEAEFGRESTMELATGRAAALEKQASFKQRALAAQEQALLTSLGLSQQADKAKQEQVQFGVTSAQTAYENRLKMEESLRSQQASILDQFSKYNTIQRQQAADALDALKGIDPSKMSAESQAQVAQIAASRGISPADMMSALSAQFKQEQLDNLIKTRQAEYEAARTGTLSGAGSKGNNAVSIAEAIMNGTQAPDLKSLYGLAGPIKAELAKRGYNLAQAQLDWTATSKRITTMNSAQQIRLSQAVDFAYDSLDIIDQLNNAYSRTGLPVLNQAQLIAQMNGIGNTKLPAPVVISVTDAKTGAPISAKLTDTQQLATMLNAQINDLTSELGTVYKGGNTSTDESLRIAAQNLKSNWNQDTLKQAVNLARLNLKIRQNSISNSAGAPVSTQYGPQPSDATNSYLDSLGLDQQ